MVVVVAQKDRWFEQTLLECLRRKASSEEFLLNINEGLAENKVDTATLLHQFKTIVHLGCSMLSGSIKLLLEYVDVLWASQKMSPPMYMQALTNFDHFERLMDVGLLTDKILHFAKTFKPEWSWEPKQHVDYTSEGECLLLCQSLFCALKWMVEGVAKLLHNSQSDLPSHITTIQKLLKGIAQLRHDPFTGLLISLYFNMIYDQLVPKEMSALQTSLKQSSMKFQQQFHDTLLTDSFVTCSQDLEQLSNTITDFATPPPLNWQPFREDFIYKQFRPAILTLGSIFATFRVLKSDEEIANSFLVVGEILGMSRPQIIFDILRTGFLIQLETAAGQPEQRDREALADMFVYLKVPQILLKLVEQGVSREDVFTALQQVSHSSTLLNELDSRKCDNTFHYIIQELKQTEVLQEQHFLQLVANRKQGLEHKPELLELLSAGEGSSRSGGVQQQSRVQLIRLAQKAKKTFEKAINLDNKKWVQMIARLMQSGEINVDTVCSVFCADGDLSAFSSKLASINSQTERATSNDAEEAKNRVLMFDSTFLLLSRIQYVYMDMRLEELVGEHTAAVFCTWTENYFLNLDKGEPMPVDAHLKQNFMGQMSLLKNCKPFWNDSWDFATLIDHIPLIGEILLDEYKKEHQNESEIHNILSTFNHMTCMMLCLVQWLETQPQSSARQAFAKSLHNFGNSRAQECSERLHKSKKEAQEGGIRKESSIQDSDDHRWLYTMLVAKKGLKQMAEGRRQKEQTYTTFINFAQRHLPTIYQTEVPDRAMLNEAFLYANQQSWASPDVIAHINRCNKSMQQATWCKCWMMQMLKSWTSDEMEMASELCLSAALTNDVPCLLEITRQLVEYVLFDANSSSRENSFSSSASSSSHFQQNYNNISINKTSATVLAKMLVRVLILLQWAEDRRKMRERLKSQRNQLLKKRKIPDGTASISYKEEPMEVKKCGNCQEDFSNTILGNSRKTSSAEEMIDGKSKSLIANEELQSTSSSKIFPSEHQKSKDPVLATIIQVFERFDKIIKGSCLRPSITFIIFFMHELAKAPRTAYWKRLLDLIPINMIFSLAKLDATAMPLPMFLSLYDVKEKKYRLHCLKYSCMMRNFNLV